MKESLTKKSYGITLSKHETTFHTFIQTFEHVASVSLYKSISMHVLQLTARFNILTTKPAMLTTTASL